MARGLFLAVEELKEAEKKEKKEATAVAAPAADSAETEIIESNKEGVDLDQDIDTVETASDDIDTLDDIETLRDSHAVKDQIEGYIAFFKELKSKYPDLSIIQNRGFSLFEQGSSVYTDALLFEDLNFQKADTNEYYKNLVHRLSSIAAKSNCRIMAISHNDRQENHIFCKKLNWLYYHCPYDNNYMKFETEIDNVSNRPWFSF